MKRAGFAILVALAIVGLVAAVMVVMAEVSQSLALDSSRRLAQARQRDLAASAAAWLRHDAGRSAKELAEGVDLDPAALSGGQLRVKLSSGGTAEVSTQTGADRYILKGTILLPPGGK